MSDDSNKAPTEGAGDLFVSLGNLSGKSIAHLREVLDREDPVVLKNYEEMVEEYIKLFNHMVTQGVPPEWAVFSFTMAYAITLGGCLRAGLSPEEGGKLMSVIIKNADASAKLIQQVTLLNMPPEGGKQ